MSGRATYHEPSSQPGNNRVQCIREVKGTELPSPVVELSEEYDRRVGERNEFLWKWIHNLFDAFTLPCVPSESWEKVKTTKTVFTMFITVLDDLADRPSGGETFEQARRIPYDTDAVNYDAPGVETEILEFAELLWNEVNTALTDAPCYNEHRDMLRFDLRQAINTMGYAQVLNGNREMANLAESRHYGPFNMVMFPYADIDLMWTPRFDRSELGELRHLLLDLQKMARIGNWVTTWERELFEDDYSAGVVVEALERDIISYEDDPETAIEAIQDNEIQEQFEAEWQSRYYEALSHDYGIESFEVNELIEGMRTVMEHHLASQGQK